MKSSTRGLHRAPRTKTRTYPSGVVHHVPAMPTTSRLSVPFALLTFLAAFPPTARARAEAGTSIENVELKTLSGGKEKLLSAKAKANVFVFFRTSHDRSLDALKQMAACEKELAGKPVYWTAVVSGSEPIADVKAVVAQ